MKLFNRVKKAVKNTQLMSCQTFNTVHVEIFTRIERSWFILPLLDKAKDIQVERVLISSLDLSSIRTQGAERLLEADTKYPILVCKDTCTIIDGRHRLTKLIANDVEYVNVKFIELGEPDIIEKMFCEPVVNVNKHYMLKLCIKNFISKL